MEEYPQVAKGGGISIGSQGEEYPQVAKGERISTSEKERVSSDGQEWLVSTRG